MAAIIPEEEASSINANDELRIDAYASSHELNEELESNGFSYESAHHCVSAVNGYVVTCMPEYQDHVNDMVSIIKKNSGVHGAINYLLMHQILTPDAGFSKSLQIVLVNEKLMLEIQSIATFPEEMVGLVFPHFLSI